VLPLIHKVRRRERGMKKEKGEQREREVETGSLNSWPL
jgi:hypothetical protein